MYIHTRDSNNKCRLLKITFKSKVDKEIKWIKYHREQLYAHICINMCVANVRLITIVER